MGFPGVYGVMFPVVIFKAALSLIVIKQTAYSVFNLLLGRGWQHSTSRVTVGSADWLYSEVDPDLGLGLDALAKEIRSRLPVVKFQEIATHPFDEEGAQCSVCLCEFEGHEEVRPLPQCSHVFHKDCLDRWLGHGQTTCPLCRATLATDEMLEKRKHLMQSESDFPSEFAVWFSSYHSTSGRGHWWQAYLQGVPDVLSGVH